MASFCSQADRVSQPRNLRFAQTRFIFFVCAQLVEFENPFGWRSGALSQIQLAKNSSGHEAGEGPERQPSSWSKHVLAASWQTVD